jgi:hypothetical protein
MAEKSYSLSGLGDTIGNLGTGVKNAAISLFKSDNAPGDYTTRLASIARQKKLADMLSQMGAQEQAVSTAGGITAPVSGMGALARGLTSFGGAYLSGKASRDEEAATAAERKAINDETARIFGRTPATEASQGDYIGDDAEGVPNYNVNAGKPASYILDPESQMDALYTLGGRSSLGEKAADRYLPFAMNRLGRAEDLQDTNAAAIAAENTYRRNRENEITDAALIRGQEVTDETRRRLTPKELSDAGYRPGTVAYIDGLGRITVPQAGETPSQIAAAKRAGQGGISPTPALLQADARALARATEASNAAIPSVEALTRSYAILSNPNSPANAALPEITFINSALSLFGNEKAKQQVTDANLLRATGDIAGIAALAGIGGSDTERELAVATRTAYSPRGTREQNKELTARKLSAFRFAADYPLLAADWIAKYGSLHPTFKDENGGTFARFADREYKRIRAEVDAMGGPDAQNTGGAGGASPANIAPFGTKATLPSGKIVSSDGKGGWK